MNDFARTEKQLGTIIQRARKSRGWTQTDLAERAGLRQATISLIENGETPSKLDSIFSVLAALDLQLRIEPRTKSERARH